MSLWDKVQASVKKTGEKAGVAAHKAKLRTDMYVHCSGGNRQGRTRTVGALSSWSQQDDLNVVPCATRPNQPTGTLTPLSLTFLQAVY